MDLKSLFAIMPQIGKVEWIGIRPKKRSPLEIVPTVMVSATGGLEGDHYGGRSGKRQVTLIQAEHIRTVAQILQLEELNPELLRRNIVVSGINLLAFNQQQFQIGSSVVLEMTGHCHPCSRMETNLGAGDYNAMRGHGGITARVLQGGQIQLGDSVKLLLQSKIS